MKIIIVLLLIATPFAGPDWGPALMVGLAGLLVYLSERDQWHLREQIRRMEQERDFAEQAPPSPEKQRWLDASRLLDTRRSELQ